MMLGFLDDLHRFSAGDVDRVAADLANEMNGLDETNVESFSPRAPQRIDGVAGRLNQIEQRLVQQESQMRRASHFFQNFFGPRSSDAS
jgi:hypothetical protein